MEPNGHHLNMIGVRSAPTSMHVVYDLSSPDLYDPVLHTWNKARTGLPIRSFVLTTAYYAHSGLGLFHVLVTTMGYFYYLLFCTSHRSRVLTMSCSSMWVNCCDWGHSAVLGSVLKSCISLVLIPLAIRIQYGLHKVVTNLLIQQSFQIYNVTKMAATAWSFYYVLYLQFCLSICVLTMEICQM